MFLIATIVSFILYVAIVTLIISGAFLNAIRQGSYIVALILVFVFIFAMITARKEWMSKIHGKSEELKNEKYAKVDTYSILFATGAAVVTFVLNNNFGLGPVIGSALVGIAGVVIFPKYQAIIFTASFTGMASYVGIQNLPLIAFAGFLTGLLWIGGRRIFGGFGGKMGASALVGTLITSSLSGNFIFQKAPTLLNVRLSLFLYFIIFLYLTYFLNKYSKTGIVLASAVIGLSAGLILPAVHGPALGLQLGGAAFAGSFVGMSVIERFEKEEYFILASVFGTIIYEFTMINFIGLGGRMGTTALTSIIATMGLIEVFKYLTESKFNSKLNLGVTKD